MRALQFGKFGSVSNLRLVELLVKYAQIAAGETLLVIGASGSSEPPQRKPVMPYQ
jgi:hypothetical protein